MNGAGEDPPHLDGEVCERSRGSLVEQSPQHQVVGVVVTEQRCVIAAERVFGNSERAGATVEGPYGVDSRPVGIVEEAQRLGFIGE